MNDLVFANSTYFDHLDKQSCRGRNLLALIPWIFQN